MEKLRTKATFMKNRFHVVLLEDDMVINEMACRIKQDIRWCCRYMLRWYIKIGGVSKTASASRRRAHKNSLTPAGKIWYEKDLRHGINNKRISKHH